MPGVQSNRERILPALLARTSSARVAAGSMLSDEEKAKRKEDILGMGWENLDPEDFDYVSADFDDIDTDGSGSLSKNEVIKYMVRAAAAPFLLARLLLL